MKGDPTLTDVKTAAKKIMKKKLVDLTVSDVIDFLITLEEESK